MTALEAKQITQNSLNNLNQEDQIAYKQIIDLILKSCSKGFSSITLKLEMPSKVKLKLKLDGYSLEENLHYTPVEYLRANCPDHDWDRYVCKISW